ncbi:MAG: riboflavin synthase [Deltaproteobacteria bacterium]|nr:riboflavin synthase [Deltaproteobacteria bacterium]
MFTGIVEQTAIICQTRRIPAGVRLVLRPKSRPVRVKIGESIAVNGCCLTLVRYRSGLLEFDVARESLKITTLGLLQKGMRVNLERSLRFGDRIGGHLVTGHVDAMGRIVSLRKYPNGAEWTISFPKKLARSILMKGSVAIDGVSLTINRVLHPKVNRRQSTFKIFLIPHTLKVTNLKDRKASDQINLEVDRLARYRGSLPK